MESETESLNGDTFHKLLNLQTADFARRKSTIRENFKNTMPGSAEYRRRSSTRDIPIMSGSVEYTRRRRSSANDNRGGTPGSVESSRRGSSNREGSLPIPGLIENQIRRTSVRPEMTPGQFLSRGPSLMPVTSSDMNARIRRGSIALPTIPNQRLRRGSVQIQNFTKPRSNTGSLKSMRRGSRHKKEKQFQVSCVFIFGY